MAIPTDKPLDATGSQVREWTLHLLKIERVPAWLWAAARSALVTKFNEGSAQVRAFDHIYQSPNLTTYENTAQAAYPGSNAGGNVIGKNVLTPLVECTLPILGVDVSYRVCRVGNDGSPLFPELHCFGQV